jgi:hypothetical protein
MKNKLKLEAAEDSRFMERKHDSEQGYNFIKCVLQEKVYVSIQMNTPFSIGGEAMMLIEFLCDDVNVHTCKQDVYSYSIFQNAIFAMFHAPSRLLQIHTQFCKAINYRRNARSEISFPCNSSNIHHIKKALNICSS